MCHESLRAISIFQSYTFLCLILFILLLRPLRSMTTPHNDCRWWDSYSLFLWDICWPLFLVYSYMLANIAHTSSVEASLPVLIVQLLFSGKSYIKTTHSKVTFLAMVFIWLLIGTVHHFGPNWSISTTIRWKLIKFLQLVLCMTFPKAPP